jgi:hypothetical protein
MSRRMIWAVAGAGIAAAMAGGAVSQAINPASSSQSLSSETSSAAPTRAALSTVENSPANTPSAVPTTAASVLPAAPVLAMTCHSAGTAATAHFGHRITAAAPYTVTIDYGDGDRYSNDDQHLKAIFAHKYLKPGTFPVAAVLTDATGQTARATCAYSRTAPASVHVSVPAPHSSTSGSGSGDTYVNVDGNTIHSPVTAPVAPSGATAKCNDGTWSFSQHHSGTCSHHGGVAEWL